MAQYNFNVGRLFGVDANGSPMEFGLLQDVSLDISRDVKELQGQNAFPEFIALGKGKISGKAQSADFNANAINMMMAGLGSINQGQYLVAQETVILTKDAPSYTVLNGTKFYRNLGVDDTTNQQKVIPYTVSATVPNTGQYQFDGTGKYTFSTADATSGKSVIVKYLWKDTTSGSTINLTNQAMGAVQYFSMFLTTQLLDKTGISKQVNVWLNSCISNKVGFGWKTEDYNKPQFDFSCVSDAIGGIGWMSIGS